MDNLDSFERMASGLSNEERTAILDKMKSNAKKNETSVLTPVEAGTEPEFVSFTEQIKRESMITRFILWVKSILTSTNVETIYNEHKTAHTASFIEKNFPGLIDHKKGLLLSDFYSKLSEIQSSASFFRPFLSAVEEAEGDFYVLLSSLVIPETNAIINSDSDPYKNPVTSASRPELRLELLHKMEDHFDAMPAADKNLMYESVKATEWLRQFIKLPFNRFLSCFSNVTDGIYSCPMTQVNQEITLFSRILCNAFTITDELLEALYLFSVKKNKLSPAGGVDADQFLSKAHSAVAIIHMFMTSVPLKSIGCVINTNPNWYPQPFAGGEDWYVRYKAAWKRIFEKKWSTWVKDCQKESLKINLKSNFDLDEFPLLPERPWTSIWGGQFFRYELTAGFLYWFLLKKFPEYELALKTIIVEGQFLKKDNQVSFTDNFNNLIQLSISYQTLIRKISSGGEMGIIFSKLREEHLKTLSAQTKVEQMIREIESDFESILHKFGDACRYLDQLLNGILGIVKDSRFDTISNLNKLQGKDNEKFQNKLSQSRAAMENSLNLIKELETLDSQKGRF